MAKETAINLLESTEYVLTPPTIGPLIQHGSREVDLRAVEPEMLQRMLNSPLSENWLNRDARRAAKNQAAKTPNAAAPAPVADEETDSDKEDGQKKGKGK